MSYLFKPVCTCGFPPYLFKSVCTCGFPLISFNLCVRVASLLSILPTTNVVEKLLLLLNLLRYSTKADFHLHNVYIEKTFLSFYFALSSDGFTL